jgi:hypothetical protein
MPSAIGRRVYNRRAGFVAATLAFCGFIYLPQRWRPWIAPVLLVVPFVFRETGASLVVPMALMILGGRLRRNLARTIGFALLVLTILLNTYKSDLSAGRTNQGYANIFDGGGLDVRLL